MKICNMAEEWVSYTLESNLESVNQAEETARRIATEMGFAEEEIYGIAMAVREATINAVLHGNAYDPAKKVQVQFDRNRHGTLRVTVHDEGKGFDLDKVPNPLEPENLLKQSGRGVFLIRSYMDEVRVRKLERGTEITMIKRIARRRRRR
jgi:serine/threonine-protein kinase RsbW